MMYSVTSFSLGHVHNIMAIANELIIDAMRNLMAQMNNANTSFTLCELCYSSILRCPIQIACW